MKNVWITSVITLFVMNMAFSNTIYTVSDVLFDKCATQFNWFCLYRNINQYMLTPVSYEKAFMSQTGTTKFKNNVKDSKLAKTSSSSMRFSSNHRMIAAISSKQMSRKELFKIKFVQLQKEHNHLEKIKNQKKELYQIYDINVLGRLTSPAYTEMDYRPSGLGKHEGFGLKLRL